MKLLRLWRQYDSIKAVVLLTAAALFLVGYCIHFSAAYAVFLQSPTEYVCTAQDVPEETAPAIAGTEGIGAYSKQRSVRLSDGRRGIDVIMLSREYISICYALPAEAHTVYMNHAAFSAMFGDVQSPVSFRGTLEGREYYASVILADGLGQNEPFAVTGVDASQLQYADTLRICMIDKNSVSPESFGLTVINREELFKADYEQKMLLLRIRFAALSAFLALIGAAAFFRLYRYAVNC